MRILLGMLAPDRGTASLAGIPVASMARGYLAGVGALILLVVVTQVVTAFGSGAWFPYAVPGLWMGMGGAGAAETVNALQLLLCVPVSIVGGAITGHGWQTMQISRG